MKPRLGWLPDLPDPRDYRYRAVMGQGMEVPFWRRAAPCLGTLRFPPTADLLQYATWPGVYDQGQLGSCTAQATVAMAHFILGKEGARVVDRGLSRLMLYGEARGWVPEDTGSTLRDSLKALASVGDCHEQLWPYELERWKEKPPLTAYTDAMNRRGITYARLSSLDDMLDCLSQGYPFVFGMSVFASFFGLSAEDDVLKLPEPGEEFEGGHALCAVGYDRGRALFRIRNSWGESWGKDGFFWLPFDYATNRGLADDFWTLRTVPV
jgi:C1A family cysteine protease